MTALTPQVSAMLSVTAGVGLLMVVSGVQKRGLEWRRRRRRCPSCGRQFLGSCRCTG
jgi:hypothetical protein